MATSLESLAQRALTRDHDRRAIEFNGKWFSWGQMRHVAQNLAALVEASGAGPSAPIAFAPRNRPSAVAALLGLIAGRRTVRMIYAFQSQAGMARDVQRLRAAVLVTADEDLGEDLLSVLRREGVAAIGLTEMEVVAVPGHERSTCPPDPDWHAEPRIEILTSGTTGPPKQFPIGYDVIARYVTATGPLSSEQDRDAQAAIPVLLFMPLGNISGVYSTVPPMLRGQRATLLERFGIAGWHDHVVRYRPQASGLPPAGVQMVLDAGIPPEDLCSVRTMSTGAAPLDPTVHRAFEARYGIPILLSYGATEFAGPVAAMTADLHEKWGERKFGSAGRALAGAALRIVDAESGAELPPGEVGLLEVISSRIGPDWIRTSDLAVIDADGFLFHRGRADGAILRGGFKLLPETIENALLLHPSISAAGVSGVADTRLGQVPAAAIQIKPGAGPPDSGELEAHLRAHLPATHIPVVWRIVDDLPKTPSFKIDRRALRELFDVR